MGALDGAKISWSREHLTFRFVYGSQAVLYKGEELIKFLRW